MSRPNSERGPDLPVAFDAPAMADDLEWAVQSGQPDRQVAAEALLGAFYSPLAQIFLALGIGAAPAAPRGDALNTASGQASEPSGSKTADAPLDTAAGAARHVTAGEFETHALLRAAFANALNKRFELRSGTDLAAWFYHAAMGALPAGYRRAWPPLAAALYAFTPLTPGQVASALGAAPKAIGAFLQRIEAAPAQTLRQAGWRISKAFAAELSVDWRAALKHRYPASEISEDQIETLALEIAARSQHGARWFQGILALRETLLIGLAIMLMAGMALLANRFFPEADRPAPTHTPQPVNVIVTRQVIQTKIVYITATPRTGLRATPTSRIYFGDYQISEDTRPSVLKERLRTLALYWDTAWGEAEITLNPKLPMDAPPMHLRAQFWVAKDRLRLVIGGQSAGQPGSEQSTPQFTLLGDDQNWIWVDRYGDAHPPLEARPTSFKPPILGDIQIGLLPINVDIPLFPRLSLSSFEVVRSQFSGRRPTLLLRSVEDDQNTPVLLSLDRVTTLPLQIKVGRPPDAAQAQIEMRIQQILYNAPFDDPALFDVQAARPAQHWTDVYGQPLPPRVTAPPTSTRAAAPGAPTASLTPLPGVAPPRLTIHYLPSIDPFAIDSEADIGLDGQIIARLPFGNPYTVVCARSDDAHFLAYSSRPPLFAADPQKRLTTIYYLTNPSARNALKIFGLEGEVMAFSPDNRRLAVYSPSSPRRGITIIDLASYSMENALFIPTQDVDTLAWAADLSYIAWFDDQGDEFGQLSAARLADGEIFHQSWYWRSGQGNELALPRPAPPSGTEACR